MLKRFSLSLLLFASLIGVATSLRPWYSRWGATSEETRMALPGDELVPHAAKQSTLAITIAAPPNWVWPWLAQVSAEYLAPQVGDQVKMCPGDFGPAPHAIAIIRPGSAFIFGGRGEIDSAWDSTWQFVLLPVEANTTRLVLRLRSANAYAFDAVFDPAFFLMERRRVQGIQERASGR